jgi:hypothetical protein
MQRVGSYSFRIRVFILERVMFMKKDIILTGDRPT